MNHPQRDGYIRIPMRAVAKARPRGKGKQFYMPKDYMAAKAQFASELKAMGASMERYPDNVDLSLEFDSDEFWIRIEPTNDTKPIHMRRADLDNVVGFVMDAMQDAGVIVNDSQVVRIDASYKQENDDG